MALEWLRRIRTRAPARDPRAGAALPAGAPPAEAPSGRPPLLIVHELVKRYRGHTALDGLSLTVERGETVVIIGGSGSGKTTLGRHLVALERPTSGHIYLDGVDITMLRDLELTRLRRRFAMVFQYGALLDSMTVFDNVAFPLREETDYGEDEIRERV